MKKKDRIKMMSGKIIIHDGLEYVWDKTLNNLDIYIEKEAEYGDETVIVTSIDKTFVRLSISGGSSQNCGTVHIEGG